MLAPSQVGHSISPSRQVGDGAARAWRSSRLASRLVADPNEMLIDAFEAELPCGALTFADASSHPKLAVIVTGLIRVYAMGPGGRQVTIRYITAGEILGLPSALAPEAYTLEPHLAVQALTRCQLLHLSVQRFRLIASRDSENMWGLFAEMATVLRGSEYMLVQNLFQPVRARVARHLLDLAAREGDRLVVRICQQDIADAIGSVREVVARAIVWLRDQELLRREGPLYVLNDPVRLHEIAELLR